MFNEAYSDLSPEEFQELITRKIVKLELDIESLSKENQ